mgnify:CR=1 FL=1
MRYGSLCSGIEAATQAWHPLGWEPAFFSEIEKFPSAVLAHHYPNVPNLGDMTKFKDWPDHAIDLLVGGTPCQSFSVAGLRKGLADPRGNLMLTFGAVAQRFRPRWLVWENVPGVLSSDGGRDFGTFLGMLGELGYGFAYRVLDAQYVRTRGHAWAVPQRRRRVFVVGYLGDWRRAAAVLFDGESLSGNPAPRREAGKGLARGFECGPQGGSLTDLAPTLDTRCKDGPIRNQLGAGVMVSNSGEVGYCLTASAQQSLDAETETLLAVTHSLRGEGFDASEDGTGRGTPIVPISFGAQNAAAQGDGVAFNFVPALDKSKTPAVAFAQNQRGELRTSEVALQLTAGGGKPGEGYPAVAFSVKDYGGDAIEGVSPTLRSGGFDKSHANGGVMPAVAFDLRGREGGAMPEGPHDTANIRASDGGSSRSYNAQPWAVRRLTPREAERLQAFPDDFTRIPYRGKPAEQCPDGPRYKALGNSWAAPVVRWIGERIGDELARIQAEKPAANDPQINQHALF